MLYNYIMVKLSPKDRKVLSQIDKNTKWKEVKEVKPVNDAIKDLDIYEERIQLMCSEYLKDSAKSGDYDDKEMFDKCREAEKVKRRVDKKTGKAQKQGKGRGISDTKLTQPNIEPKKEEEKEKPMTKEEIAQQEKQFKELEGELTKSVDNLVKEFGKKPEDSSIDTSSLGAFIVSLTTTLGDPICAVGLTKSIPIILSSVFRRIGNFSINDIGYGEDTGLISTRTYDALIELGEYCGVSIGTRLLPFLTGIGVEVSRNIVRVGKPFINRLTGDSGIDLDDDGGDGGGGGGGGEGGSGGLQPQQQAEPQTYEQLKARAESIATAKAQTEAQSQKLQEEMGKSAKSVLEQQNKKAQLKPNNLGQTTEPTTKKEKEAVNTQQAPTPPTIQNLDTGRGTGKVKSPQDIANEIAGSGWFELGTKTARKIGSIAGDTLVGGLTALGSFQLAKNILGTGADLPQQQQQDLPQTQQQDLQDRLNKNDKQINEHEKRMKDKHDKEAQRAIDEMGKLGRARGLGLDLFSFGGGSEKMATGISSLLPMLGRNEGQSLTETEQLTPYQSQLTPYQTGQRSLSRSQENVIHEHIPTPLAPQPDINEDKPKSPTIDRVKRATEEIKEETRAVLQALQTDQQLLESDIDFVDLSGRLDNQAGVANSIQQIQGMRRVGRPTRQEADEYEINEIVSAILKGETKTEQEYILSQVLYQEPAENIISEVIKRLDNTKPPAE